MKILLIGEYSGLHNSLKEGLISLGHEVYLVGSGDGFKAYPVDFKLDHSFHGSFLKKISKVFFKLTGLKLGTTEIYLKTLVHQNKFKGFDIVQLINEYSIKSTPKNEIKFLKKIKKHNDKLFYLCCGVDYISMKFMMEGLFKYSLMDAYIKDPSLHSVYQFQLKYLKKGHIPLHDFIMKHSQGVIASDMDYHLPFEHHAKYLGLIANPINIDKIQYIPMESMDKIKIFHGINEAAVHKKGNDYFSKALEIIQDSYGNQVEIITTYSIPYDQYIELYNSCHILMDQVFGYDQGYNALEAMAKGKVVFTGAEKEWLEYYGLEEDTVAINALPDVDYLVNKLSWLIENPQSIIEISKNARAFIEKEHDYRRVAEKYLNTWISH